LDDEHSAVIGGAVGKRGQAATELHFIGANRAFENLQAELELAAEGILYPAGNLLG
jgi:hypothetical protein